MAGERLHALRVAALAQHVVIQRIAAAAFRLRRQHQSAVLKQIFLATTKIQESVETAIGINLLRCKQILLFFFFNSICLPRTCSTGCGSSCPTRRRGQSLPVRARALSAADTRSTAAQTSCEPKLVTSTKNI